MGGVMKRSGLSSEKNRYFFLPVFIVTMAAMLVFPVSVAYGVQSHGAAEGLVSHQLGHLLFFAGMISILVRIRRASFSGAGWKEFKGFLWLILCWNGLTFAAHWMREGVTGEQFLRHSGRVTAFQAETLFDLIFYLTRLDHLLLVPAFFLLLSALRKWGLER